MGKLIVNADDFGYCEAVNQGIIYAHKKGVVNSTTIMANMPGFDSAVELLKENKDLKCGVHMTMTCYKPVLNNLKTLVDENGYFHRRLTKEVVESVDLDELYEEFCAQIDKAKKYIDITHLDSHHHAHREERFRPVIQKIVDKYKLPIRMNICRENLQNIGFIEEFYSDNVCVEWFEKHADFINSHEVVDMMCHPAMLDEFIYKSTSYNINRMKELEVLTNPKVKEILEKHEIKTTNYKDM